MSERIPKGVAKLVVFRAVLASDGKTAATGKTIPITISKNGATSFSNLAAGAVNATEMASGFYKFTLATDDIDTVGPLAWKGAEGTIVDVGDVFSVVGDVTIAGQLIIQNGVDVSCTTSNRNAIVATGNASGSALRLIGGSSGGSAALFLSGGGNPTSIIYVGPGSSGTIGVQIDAFGNALQASSGNGMGIWAYGATAGARFENTGTGPAISLIAPDGDGIDADTSVAGGFGFNGTSDGSITNSGLATPSQVNAEVLDVVGTDTLVAGVSIKEALRRQGAILSGKVTGAGTGSETFKDYAESASTIVITVDSSGNRGSITYN